MGLRQEIVDRMSGNIAGQKEQEIIRCVREAAGYDETIYALAPRGNLAYYPDGAEVFSFDGVPLLKFGPIELEYVDEGHAMKVKATRRVQRLNAAE